jgi:hypothetical protein
MPKPSFLLLPPEEIEGIGPARAEALRAKGITTIAEMFGAGAPRVHALCPTAGKAEVGEWFCKAMLLRVPGVTSDLADALVKGGTRSVSKLAAADLADLEAAVTHSRSAPGGLRSTVTLYELAGLQKAAWKLQGFGMLAGRLRHRNGQPVQGAVVNIGAREAATGSNGWYAFDKVDIGEIHIRIRLRTRPLPLEMPAVEVRDGKLTGPLLHRLTTSPEAEFNLPVMREMDGHPIAFRRGSRLELVTRPLEEFADGSLLQVRHLGKDGYARLLCFYKERLGNLIYIPRARVKTADLPQGAVDGSMLRYTSGKLELTDLTRRNVAALKRRQWEDTAPGATRRVVHLSPRRKEPRP